MLRKLKRIEPLSFAKISGVGHAAVGILFIPLMIIGPIIAAMIPQNGQENIPTGLFLGMGIGIALAMPIIYGAMGFVMGLISGYVYNLLAKWVGGIEFEIE